MTPTGTKSVSALKNGMSDRRTKMKLSPKTTRPAALPQARRPIRLAAGVPRRLSRRVNPAAGRLRNAMRHA
ncbi:hypothetical protein GCM10027598_08810 [Amycolatopsis oliviviridis]|uniref:Uncharacterized protein n=1 Tax=Amycolatopsis oliviviridis TaxID=1471590 RepID=A0ABQ3LRU4_9PSEU|nr:hypothetical protein GCM10017790_42220 [Amycolatopsis oliviviridis]